MLKLTRSVKGITVEVREVRKGVEKITTLFF
jgi:hypothetical protein